MKHLLVMGKIWLKINTKNKTIMKVLFFQNYYLNINVDYFTGKHVQYWMLSKLRKLCQ